MKIFPHSVSVLACLMVVSANWARAQEGTQTSWKNTIYLEATFLVAIANGSINYDLMFDRHLSWRFGYGLGDALDARPAHGFLTTGNLLLGDGSSRWEIGTGLSYMKRDYERWRFYPSCVLGYRYQPLESGVFFRTGLTWVYLYGVPVQVSVGYTI